MTPPHSSKTKCFSRHFQPQFDLWKRDNTWWWWNWMMNWMNYASNRWPVGLQLPCLWDPSFAVIFLPYVVHLNSLTGILVADRFCKDVSNNFKAAIGKNPTGLVVLPYVLWQTQKTYFAAKLRPCALGIWTLGPILVGSKSQSPLFSLQRACWSHLRRTRAHIFLKLCSDIFPQPSYTSDRIVPQTAGGLLPDSPCYDYSYNM